MSSAANPIRTKIARACWAFNLCMWAYWIYRDGWTAGLVQIIGVLILATVLGLLGYLIFEGK